MGKGSTCCDYGGAKAKGQEWEPLTQKKTQGDGFSSGLWKGVRSADTLFH